MFTPGLVDPSPDKTVDDKVDAIQLTHIFPIVFAEYKESHLECFEDVKRAANSVEG
jgi:hypothetical protein